MGETLDAGGDAQKQCQLVFGRRLGGKIICTIKVSCTAASFHYGAEMWRAQLMFVLCLQLFLFLQDFSQRMLSKTHEIEKQLDGLIRDTKATDCCLHTVFNDFLMLSNTQFIENVLYVVLM